MVMAHTSHTGRAAWLWYHLVTLRCQRLAQVVARRRWQRAQQLQLRALAVSLGFGPAPVRPSVFARFLGWVEWLTTSQREAARRELWAARQQARRAQWPRRYQ